MTLETRAVFPVHGLELRQVGGVRKLTGAFKYGDRATISDRDDVRKEEFLRGAFDFSVNSTPTKEIHILKGHNYDNVVGRRAGAGQKPGNTIITENADGVQFETVLPEGAAYNEAQRAVILDFDLGFIGGVSPGFQVPPSTVVANAVRVVAEPNNPGVFIRQIAAALLFELSLVARPAYQNSEVDAELRAVFGGAPAARSRPFDWLRVL